MSDLAGIIEAVIEQARQAQAKAARAPGQPPRPVPSSGGGQVAPSAALPVARPRPAPPRPAPPQAPPPVVALQPERPAVPLLFPFRDRKALLASIVFAEALAPPLALVPRKLPSW